MNNNLFSARPPWYYDYVNAVNGMGFKPSTSHVKDNQAAYFFKRNLIQRAMSPFKFTLPENWDRDYFLYCLYCFGFVGVLKTDKYGVIPQQCGLKGYNIYYRPKEIIITNPLLKSNIELAIGKTCELINLEPDYRGITDFVEYYGDLLALCYEALNMNIANSKLAYAFSASKKSIAEAFKKMFDNVQGGDLMTVYDKDLTDPVTGAKPWEAIFNDLSKNYIALELIETMRDINNMFDTEIGIDNNTVAKKRERVNTAEVNANNAETFTKVDLWYDSISSAFRRVNDMFYNGANVCQVEWREVPDIAKNDNRNDRILQAGADTI